jgi:hypothetical protein
VPSLDRLSWPLADLIGIADTLRRRGVGFKSPVVAPGQHHLAAACSSKSSKSSPRWPSSFAS